MSYKTSPSYSYKKMELKQRKSIPILKRIARRGQKSIDLTPAKPIKLHPFLEAYTASAAGRSYELSVYNGRFTNWSVSTVFLPHQTYPPQTDPYLVTNWDANWAVNGKNRPLLESQYNDVKKSIEKFGVNRFEDTLKRVLVLPLDQTDKLDASEINSLVLSEKETNAVKVAEPYEVGMVAYEYPTFYMFARDGAADDKGRSFRFYLPK